MCTMIKINSSPYKACLFASLLARTLEHRGKFHTSSRQPLRADHVA